MSQYQLPDISHDLSKCRILVTNDDGIFAPGLEILEKIAGQLSDDVWVVAPESEKSGAGHSLTLTEPLRMRKISARHYAVRGTPTDCVLMAIKKVLADRKPDLVLSGVNRGANMGEDVTYSGTVAAAMEGTILGVPSIALSQTIFPKSDHADFESAEIYGAGIVRWLMQQGWPANILMNVNFPDMRNVGVTGVEVTRQGGADMADTSLEERTDMRGNAYYWIGYARPRTHLEDGTDIKAVREGRISVSALHLDLTHEESFRSLKSAWDKTAGGA